VKHSYRDIAREGLWTNNPGLVQLLGLCPLLAVTGTAVNGFGLGIATILVLVGSNLAVSFIRHAVRPEIRIPVFVMIIASLVTAVELIMNAFFHELFLVLGIFIPLIVTNCTIIGRAEAFASRNPMPRAFMDGLCMGLGFTAVLVVLGGFRELIGHGTVLSDAHMMFGAGVDLTVRLWDRYDGFLLAVLPPGAFIGLGLLVALKNRIDADLARRRAVAVPVARAGRA
jgi:electron transport complex protein RnfE